ncbi:hypothetical protein LLG39_10165 [bacterium]|nr:hypothetical protein [bacterium]
MYRETLSMLIMIAILGLIACAAYAQPLDDIMIGGWWVPQSAQVSLTRCSEYAGAGYNFMIGDIASTPADNKKILDNCERYGIKAYIYDPRVANLQLGDSNFNATLDTVVAEYAGYPALAGYYLMDEPGASQYARLGAINNYLLSKDPSRGAFINLFPNYATTSQMGTSTYGQYLDQFIATVHPTILSYDHYSQMATYTGDAYFQNLESVRTRAMANNISFDNIYLVMGHYNFRCPTYGELRWQMFTTLAYGARSYMHFTYWSPTYDPNVTGVGVIDANGNRTAYYPMVQELNSETKALSPMLTNLQSDKIYHTGYVPSGCSGLPSGEVITSVTGGNSLLGFFLGSGGARYVMVVNKDMQYDRTLTINFNSQVALYEVSKTTGEHVWVGRQQSFSMPFTMGECRLFAIDPSFWEFNVDDQPEYWWIPQHVTNFCVNNGALWATVTGSDPYLLGPPTPLIDASAKRYAYVRMATTAGSQAGILWQSPTQQTYSEDRAVRFDVIPDGQFHDYLLDMSSNSQWTGKVQNLRFEPSKVATSGTFGIDFIRVVGDIYPPRGSISINSGATYSNSNSVTLTLTAEDIATGVSQVRFSNNNSTWSSWQTFATMKPWTMLAEEGKKYIYVQFKDGAGNISKSYSDSIIVDTSIPTGSISISSGDKYTKSGAITLSISAADTGTGVSQMRFNYSDDPAMWQAWEPYRTSKYWTMPSGDGLKTAYVQFKDAVGYISPTYSTSIIVDTTGPSAPVMDDSKAFVVGTTVEFNWAASDDGTGSGVKSYNCQIGTAPGLADVFNGDVGNVLSKQVAGSYGTRYYCRVQAKDNLDNIGSWGLSTNGVSAVRTAAEYISTAKTLTNMDSIGLTDCIVTGVFADCFYVESSNRTSGIMIKPADGIPDGLAVGKSVDVGGIIDTNSQGERWINATVRIRS